MPWIGAFTSLATTSATMFSIIAMTPKPPINISRNNH